jgi:polyhydroxybutyrate depolymerase
MKSWHLLLTVALATTGWLATTTAGAAEVRKDKPVRSRAAKPHQPAKPKPTPKAPRRDADSAQRQLPLPQQTIVGTRPPMDTESFINRPGDYSFVIQHQGRARTYRLHVPQGYLPTETVPLVVALQGGGTDALAQDGFHGLVRESDRHRFAVVFPDAWRAPGQALAVWNAGNCCGAAREQNIDDVSFVEKVVHNVFRQVMVQRWRIYAVGFSDGGMMAYRLACDRPRMFKAVASVGGTDNTSDCAPDRAVSVLHIHARNDPRVPFGGVPDAGRAQGFTSAPDTAAKWAQLDGCMATPRNTLTKAGATCDAYTYCRAEAEVRLCATDTGGHSWPGAQARRGEAAPSQAISATKAAWTFFNAH